MSYKEKVIELVAKQHADIELDDEALASSFAEIGIDSIDLMTIILLIKKEMGVEVSDDALLDITSLRDLITYLDKQD
ncbi:acyl carrier protein [Pseudoalteromonas sp. YIC-656]|uniref:acyl carrier protein n=1 Tax=Pseudoalteromonas pernae TaxID=3118054 RepID=UPI003241D45F